MDSWYPTRHREKSPKESNEQTPSPPLGGRLFDMSYDPVQPWNVRYRPLKFKRETCHASESRVLSKRLYHNRLLQRSHRVSKTPGKPTRNIWDPKKTAVGVRDYFVQKIKHNKIKEEAETHPMYAISKPLGTIFKHSEHSLQEHYQGRVVQQRTHPR